MNFSDVEQRYVTLKQQYQAGQLTADAFDAQLKAMMVQDTQGHWWAKSREKGEWHYYDLSTSSWIRATPPTSGSPAALPPDPPVARTTPPQPTR